MDPLILHQFHEGLGAGFFEVNGMEVVGQYGSVQAEHTALTQTAGFLDFGFRSRLCLTGADRVRFLHGQATNDINRLRPGHGCYAALVTAKGRMQSDLNVFLLADELLLDFEPGFTASVADRLRQFIVADDVEVVDVAALYGLLSVQGPRAAEVVRKVEIFASIPAQPFQFSQATDANLGEVYLVRQPRLGTEGFDLFVPTPTLRAVAERLVARTRAVGGCPCGWTAWETARVERGIPRFGLDMNETNLPQECGIEDRAVSYNKGCYIGQEVLNRLHTLGHVNREIRGLCLDDSTGAIPQPGEKLVHAGKEVGSITSAVRSLRWNRIIALGIVRRESNQIGTSLTLLSGTQSRTARVVPLPFDLTADSAP